MQRSARLLVFATAAVASFGMGSSASAQVGMPAGFQTTTVAGFVAPTAFAAVPDGRVFVAEKMGRVKVYKLGTALPPRLVLDISSHVNPYGDRGMLGIAADRDFRHNGFLYLYYVYEHNASDKQGPKVARLTRIKVNADDTVANPLAPETVILGSYAPPPTAKASCPAPNEHVDCIPAETASHNGGAVRAGDDGSIWLAIGDGNLGFHEPGRFRPYDERSLAGKIVRVDRNGRGLPGHPFCPGDLDLTKVCTKLWAKGFRNPFRMTLRPQGMTPVVGDVGQNRFEEVDLAAPGRNYGWPCYEGFVHHSSLENTPRCQQEYALEGTPSASMAPLWAYAHQPGVGAAVIAGPQYTGASFPGLYRDSIFIGDYVKGTIERVIVDSSDNFVRVEPFAREWRGVDLQQMPDGRLGYILLTGTFGTIGYSGANAAPTAAARATPDHGALPLEVEFDAAGSRDTDGDPLSCEWSFGDGTPAAYGHAVRHTYTRPGRFTATVTVRDGRGGVDIETVTVWAGDLAPETEIVTPADGSLYRNGVPVRLRGQAHDPEDGALSGEALTWKVVLHHGIHQHPLDTATGAETQFTPLVDHDSDSWYEVTLTARDTQGLGSSRTIALRPETIQLTLASDPPGAVLSYAGLDQVAPFTVTAAVAFRGAVSAPTTLVRDGITHLFSHWSDGGAQAHTYTVPADDATLTAVYVTDSDPPETTITKKPWLHTPFKRNTFEFVADEPSTFQCRLDGGGWFPCRSPYTTPEQRGWHKFEVRAVDHVGNVDPTPAHFAYHVYT